MKRALPLIATLACLTAGSVIAAGGPELVLVASKRSPLGSMTVVDARRVFLGVPVMVNGQALRPVRNVSDGVVTEMFMQKVMFMSAERYERQIRNRVGRMGGGRPASYEEVPDLTAALQRDPLAVSYMPRSLAGAGSGLKIVGVP